MVWQSNFAIEGHPVITNGFLQKDVACQRQQVERGAARGLPMAELPDWGLGTKQAHTERAATWPKSRRKGDWHLSQKGFYAVAAAVLEALHRPPANLHVS